MQNSIYTANQPFFLKSETDIINIMLSSIGKSKSIITDTFDIYTDLFALCSTLP